MFDLDTHRIYFTSCPGRFQVSNHNFIDISSLGNYCQSNVPILVCHHYNRLYIGAKHKINNHILQGQSNFNHMRTQTLYPSHSVAQSLPTPGFHLLKLATEMLYSIWMLAQVSPLTTLCHFLHEQETPGCVGVGALVQPGFVAVVVVAGGSVGVPGIPCSLALSNLASNWEKRTNTIVISNLKPRAVTANSRVPFKELVERECAVFLGDSGTGVTFDSLLERGTCVDNAGLGRRWSGGCSRCRRGRGRGRPCSWGPWNTDAVVVLGP